MIYLLCSIAAIMSIVIAYILNKMALNTKKHRKIKETIVVVLSIIFYIAITIFLLKQNPYV